MILTKFVSLNRLRHARPAYVLLSEPVCQVPVQYLLRHSIPAVTCSLVQCDITEISLRPFCDVIPSKLHILASWSPLWSTRPVCKVSVDRHGTEETATRSRRQTATTERARRVIVDKDTPRLLAVRHFKTVI